MAQWILAAVVAAIAAAAWFGWSARRDRLARDARKARYRRRRGHQSAWDTVIGRARYRRLTDQRPDRERD